jgi:transposase InsO family protein
MDIADCGEGDGGYRYFVIAVDLFTRWVEGRLLKNATSEAVRDFLDQEWVCRHGRPHTLLTDNGSNLVSPEMAAYTRENHILHWQSTKYNPEENGAAEHVVKVTKAAIRALVAGHQKDWPRHFYAALLQSRSAFNEAIGMSPYFACYGRSLDQGLPLPLRPLQHASSVQQHAEQRARRQVDIEAELRQQQEAAKEKQKKYYDKQHVPAVFKAGDLVLKKKVRNQPGEVRSLEQAWDGPFEVLTVGPANSFTIRAVANAQDVREAAANQLKGFIQRDDQRLEEPAGEDMYEIEDIWQEQPLGDSVQYLVKWKGYTPKHMTWEPASAIPAGNPVLVAFKRRPQADRLRPPKGKTVPKCVLKKLLQVEKPTSEEEEPEEGVLQGHGVITKSGRQVRVPAGLQEQLMAVVMGRSELPVLLLAEA